MMKTRYFVSFNKEQIQYLPTPLNKIHEYISNIYSDLKILNVYYRYFESTKTLLLMLQYPQYDPNLFFNIQALLELNKLYDIIIHNITIYKDPVYDRSKYNQRILIYGEKIYTISIDNTILKCTVDSFLQNNIHIAFKMYKDIFDKLIYISDLVDFYGFGEDVLNIFNSSYYKNKKIVCNLHCQETKLTATNTNQILLDFPDFIRDIENNKKLKIIFITPGRNGLTNEYINIINKLDINLIIYISCKKKSMCNDIAKLNYIVIKQYEYPEMFIDIKNDEYMETVTYLKSKKYNKISIGNDCSIGYNLKKIDKNETFPFDWGQTNNLKFVIDIIKNSKIFFENMLFEIPPEYIKETNKHQYEENIMNENSTDVLIKYKVKSIIFPHNIRKHRITDDIKDFEQTMKRRFDRLNNIQISKRIFIRYEFKKQNMDLLPELLNYCEYLIVIYPSTYKHELITNSRILYIKDTHYINYTTWHREYLYDIFDSINLIF